jgi:hypothetical protein
VCRASTIRRARACGVEIKQLWISLNERGIALDASSERNVA